MLIDDLENITLLRASRNLGDSVQIHVQLLGIDKGLINLWGYFEFLFFQVIERRIMRNRACIGQLVERLVGNARVERERA